MDMAYNQAPVCSLLEICRASVHQKSRRGYHRLGKETTTDPSEPKSAKVPSIKVKKIVVLSKRIPKTTKISKPENTASIPPQTGKCSVKDATRSHPLLSFLGGSGSRRKVAKLKPEFIRYLEYVREGGRWDADADGPVMYFN